MSALRFGVKVPWLLLVAACGGGTPEPASNQAAAPAAAPAANLAAAAPADEAARVEAQARAALAAVLPGAATAPLLGVRTGVNGAVCGEVGTPAGFRGFIAPPEGRPVIARAERLDLSDRDDPFPPLYIRWCATTEELIALEPELAGAAAAPEADLPAEAPPAETQPPEPAAERPAPRPRRPAQETGRFSDAVLRPGER